MCLNRQKNIKAKIKLLFPNDKKKIDVLISKLFSAFTNKCYCLNLVGRKKNENCISFSLQQYNISLHGNYNRTKISIFTIQDPKLVKFRNALNWFHVLISFGFLFINKRK